MFIFPQGLYVDVRLEESVTTEIRFKQRTRTEVRRIKGALIRSDG